jgi:uncharacterized membrane protein YfcA
MAPWPAFVVAGIALGTLTGLFGVGGSSIATPLLAVLGVPPLLAVASPLPATIPSALAAATPYLRRHEARPRAAGWTLLGGIPAAIVGSLLSRAVGGPALLIASGVALMVVGLRVLRPIEERVRVAGAARGRTARSWWVPPRASECSPVSSRTAAGSSSFRCTCSCSDSTCGKRREPGLLVIAALAVPTLATHWWLGHIDWVVAAAFALGSVPASAVSGRMAHRVTGRALRHGFGWFLIGSGAAFIVYRLLAS